MKNEKIHNWREVKSLEKIRRLTYKLSQKNNGTRDLLRGKVVTIGTGVNNILYHIKRTTTKNESGIVYHVWLKKTRENWRD